MPKLEEVARAIVAKRYGHYAKWDELGLSGQAVWTDVARAALQALREPSEEMLTEGDELITSSLDSSRDVWRAMIDKAMEE